MARKRPSDAPSCVNRSRTRVQAKNSNPVTEAYESEGSVSGNYEGPTFGADSSDLKSVRRWEDYRENFKGDLVHFVDACGDYFNVGEIQVSLVEESLYFKNRILSSVVERQGTRIIVRIPTESPLTPSVFQMVMNFCSRQRRGFVVTLCNVVQLCIASEFLGMKNLKSRALAYFDGITLGTMDACLLILSTFDSNHLPEVESKYLPDAPGPVAAQRPICGDSLVDSFGHKNLARRLFERMSNALVDALDTFVSETGGSTRLCNVANILQVAERLPFGVAELLYGCFVDQQYGLFYWNDLTRVNLCDHAPLLQSNVHDIHDIAANTRSGLKMEVCGGFGLVPVPTSAFVQVRYHSGRDVVADGLMTEVRNKLPDIRRRSLLILYMVRLIRFHEKDRNCMTVVCFYFLRALLLEATELSRTLEGKSGVPQQKPDKHSDLVKSGLKEEIGCLETLLGGFFRTARIEEMKAILSEQRDPIALLGKCSFSGLLSIATRLQHSQDRERLEMTSKFLDPVLLAHMKDSSFCVEQAIQIYKIFPSREHTSHLEMYRVFEDHLGRSFLTRKNSNNITKLFDYRKLPNDIVELLWTKFGSGCNHSRMHERVIEIREKKIAEAEIEHVRLRSELDNVRLEVKNLCSSLGERTDALRNEVCQPQESQGEKELGPM